MAQAYFHNLTNQDVWIILNNTPSAAKRIDRLVHDEYTGEFYFAYISFPRNTDAYPGSAFGRVNRISFAFKDAKFSYLDGVKDSPDSDEEIVVFVYSSSLVVCTQGNAYLYQVGNPGIVVSI